MPNDSYTQQALAADPKFQTRLKSCVGNVAWQVMAEPDETPYHAEREAFARQVIGQLEFYAKSFSPWIVTRTNLFAAETSYNFPAGAVVTAATDSAIESQVMSDWNDIAGVVPPTGGPARMAGMGMVQPPLQAPAVPPPVRADLPMPPQPGTAPSIPGPPPADVKQPPRKG